ncbi:hypothetical protein F4818DRAFT_84515 [Hypoxylon cercidicola]|nr:hypothetical protein F4818DRAFT_84515 [Hypoxylon cercidicola]
MAPSVVTDDYYAVLGVARTADADSLKAAWRRLARIKHPDKNPGNPTATAEFQLLESAYSTLCDPARRWAYDLQFPPTFTKNGTTSGAYYSYASTASNNSSEQKNRERESRRDRLYDEARRQEADVFEARRSRNRILEEIKKLDKEAEKDIVEESGWWGYFSSMMPGSEKQREEKLRERERRGLDRIAAKRIKERVLERETVKVSLLELILKGTQDEIRKITLEINKWKEEQAAAWRREAQRQQEQAAARRREEQRQQEQQAEARRREAQQQKEQAAARQQEEQRKQQEQAAARRREAQRQQEEFTRRERVRRKEEEAEAARRISEWEERRRREREEESARLFEKHRRAQREREELATCNHRGWWKKIDGPHLCSNCSTKTNRFALQCPKCNKVACASCRKSLQTNGPRDKKPRGGI